MFKIKKIICGLSALALMLGLTSAPSISAYSYNHTFRQPFSGCADTTPSKVVTDSPYVRPSVNATQTTYCLLVPSSITVASSFVKTGSTSKKSFTYKSGYGGKGTKLRMNYYPSNANFSTYNVYGKWEP